MVKAVETSLRELLEGTKQYQVPLYQRTYAWKKEQLDRLWDDVIQLAQDRERSGGGPTHFMGSLVLALTGDIGPAGLSRYLVVDGQQRLTTLTLLLAALRDHRAQTESADHCDRIDEQFLINKWRKGDERLKLLPTQADRVSYLACIDGGSGAGSADSIGEAYRFFAGRLVDHDDPDDAEDIERLEEAVLSGLTLVSVTTAQEDNVYRIFESLNNTGLKLTQGDLLRNYLFMRLPRRGEVLYETVWLPLQRRLTNDQLELLFWLDAVQRDDSVNQRETYRAQVTRLDALPGEAPIVEEMHRFYRLSGLLELILNPELESDPAVRERLSRLETWGTTTAYPLLLHLLDRRASGQASSEEIAAAMLYVESFLIRRMVIGRATNNLNRILLGAVPQIAGSSPVDVALRRYLSTGRKFFATDEQVRQGARSNSFYFSGRTAQRKLVLTWLEQTFGSKEPVDPQTCTIEHVLPQTLTPTWRDMLHADLEPGENRSEVYDTLLHTLGNLTLSGYNSSLGNRPFAEKREKLAHSGLFMNQTIAEQEAWSRSEILARADDLADRIIDIWPGPDPAAEQQDVGASWGLLNRVLAELPAGAWTTYGDLAQVLGSHAVPVGQRIATHHVPNGHRVLQSGGTTSPGFRWYPGSTRTEGQQDALAAEGVRFDSSGRADPAQHIGAAELAELAGLDVNSEAATQPSSTGGGNGDRGTAESFTAQLNALQAPDTAKGVQVTIDGWAGLGGRVSFGRSDETSCFTVYDRSHDDQTDEIWPLALYPMQGKAEVVFQYLKTRAPFDDASLRNEMRRRLNTVEGITLPESKLGLRPSFPLDVLADAERRGAVLDVLRWFIDTCHQDRP